MEMNNDLFMITPTTAALMLKCSPQTVCNLADRGELACIRDSSGRRLFTRSAIEALLRKRRERERAE